MSLVITEQVIRGIVDRVLGCEYVGEIKLSFLKETDITTGLETEYGTSVALGLNNVDKPLCISVDLTDYAFLSYFEKEIRDRNLNLVSYYTGTRSLETETMI